MSEHEVQELLTYIKTTLRIYGFKHVMTSTLIRARHSRVNIEVQNLKVSKSRKVSFSLNRLNMKECHLNRTKKVTIKFFEWTFINGGIKDRKDESTKKGRPNLTLLV